jgi:DNA (cytosine-5)-methyltransferase 1
MIETVLSLFPGVGLLEMPFVEAGYSVVRGPDLFHGGDMRTFRVSRGLYNGILAGPPCQGFSAANEFRGDMTHHSVINSLEMLAIAVKTIEASQPDWFLIENVPSVPSVLIDGYKIQTIAVNDYEFGGNQIRWRKLQFGHRDGLHLRLKRINEGSPRRKRGRRPTAITTKPRSKNMTYADQCRLQGLTKPIDLPGMTRTLKFRLIGNGVPLPIGRAVCDGIKSLSSAIQETDCVCGCGRIVSGGSHIHGSATCRKRMQKNRERSDADFFHAANPVFSKFFSNLNNLQKNR